MNRKVYKDIHRYPKIMRKITVREGNLSLGEKVEIIYEKKITTFGNSAKLDAPKKYIGWRAYVIIVKN
jgi:putative transposon-encoded protein